MDTTTLRQLRELLDDLIWEARDAKEITEIDRVRLIIDDMLESE